MDRSVHMNAGVDYELFYEILLNLREDFHHKTPRKPPPLGVGRNRRSQSYRSYEIFLLKIVLFLLTYTTYYIII